MNHIGLFEAKTKFSELCQKVSKGRKGIVITHRGKPLVRLEPIKEAKGAGDVWDAREAYDKKHGRQKEDFELPPRQRASFRNPLD